MDAGIARGTTDEVLGRLERAFAGWSEDDGPRVVATDADQTLWDGDVGFDLFEALLDARGTRAEARAALAVEAEACGLSVKPGDDAHALAARLYEVFEAGGYEESRAFAMMAWAFAGWSEDEVRGFADRTFARLRLEERVRPGLLAVVRWAQAHRVRVLVVSASPQLAVERAVVAFDIPPADVMAMCPKVEAGIVQPSMAAPPTYGRGKVLAVERALGARAGGATKLLAAFGDSVYDADMMRLSVVPVAVTPAPKLLAVCGSIPGVVVLDQPVAPVGQR
ncbi:HAD family hydrolase [Chondromyces crocatus]|uniref:Haloacid dehalogenase n=1 Tax=Chondromyces crocatus TaxID=52 RepID=A0A0K1E8H2_CHOCO|nr:haloacid dehalogenase-like hydrolase [Chondromyces crocatus]AKT36987.1 haloacid dehalogenase [Chondromyces crocatus]